MELTDKLNGKIGHIPVDPTKLGIWGVINRGRDPSKITSRFFKLDIEDSPVYELNGGNDDILRIYYELGVDKVLVATLFEGVRVVTDNKERQITKPELDILSYYIKKLGSYDPSLLNPGQVAHSMREMLYLHMPRGMLPKPKLSFFQ